MTAYEVDYEWVHLRHEEKIAFTETYGFSGTQGIVNLEGILIRPRGQHSCTLMVYMHPASTLHLLPVPRAAAAAGAHVLCAASRYARNDAALIMEKVLLDLGSRKVNGSGLLGAMTTGAATSRSADYQLALATDKTTSYASVRSADIAGLLRAESPTRNRGVQRRGAGRPSGSTTRGWMSPSSGSSANCRAMVASTWLRVDSSGSST